MIFGNPDIFAIQIEVIPEWSSDSFQEGLFVMFLNRQRLSTTFAHADTLTVATGQLLHRLEHRFQSVAKPVPLTPACVGKSDVELFRSLNDLTYPLDATDLSVDNCWDYVISPDAMTDRGFHVFIYEDCDREVLIGGSADTKIVVSTSMPLGTTLAIAKKANEHALSLP